MDLSISNCYDSFHDLLMLSIPQLEVLQFVSGDVHLMRCDNPPTSDQLA